MSSYCKNRSGGRKGFNDHFFCSNDPSSFVDHAGNLQWSNRSRSLHPKIRGLLGQQWLVRRRKTEPFDMCPDRTLESAPLGIRLCHCPYLRGSDQTVESKVWWFRPDRTAPDAAQHQMAERR